MSREKYKSDGYFEEYIEYEKNRVARFSAMLSSLKESDMSGIEQCQRYIASFEKNILTALYSYGAVKAEIKEEFYRYLGAIEICGISDYAEMVDALSIAILLETPADRLRGILDNQTFDDSLTKALKEYLATGKRIIEGENLIFENHYKAFWDYLKEDGDVFTEGFISYINEKWYLSCKDMSWYGSHASKENTYAGYWCWLGAALLKMKGIEWKGGNIEYIPVELL